MPNYNENKPGSSGSNAGKGQQSGRTDQPKTGATTPGQNQSKPGMKEEVNKSGMGQGSSKK